MKCKKNMRKLAVLMTAVIVMLVMILTGCGSKEPQKATLALEANPTTGYEWSAEQKPNIFDISSEYVQDENEEGMSGVGGTETFTLTPNKAGTTEITFTYAQPWEKGSTATILTYQVTVDKDMQITVDATKGEMPGNESEVPEIPEMVIE